MIRQNAPMTTRLLLCLLLLTGCSAVQEPEPEGPLSGERLVEELREGGYVIVLRHTATTEGGVDDPTRLEDCASQRNLSEEGRAQATALGDAVEELDVPVGQVLASPYCRTLDTATLAFGEDVEKEPALLPLPGTGATGNDEAVIAVERLLATEPADGTNTVLVTHVSVIEPVTGATPDEGGATVLRPEGDGDFRIVAEIPPAGWARLLEQVS